MPGKIGVGPPTRGVDSVYLTHRRTSTPHIATPHRPHRPHRHTSPPPTSPLTSPTTPTSPASPPRSNRHCPPLWSPRVQPSRNWIPKKGKKPAPPTANRGIHRPILFHCTHTRALHLPSGSGARPRDLLARPCQHPSQHRLRHPLTRFPLHPVRGSGEGAYYQAQTH